MTTVRNILIGILALLVPTVYITTIIYMVSLIIPHHLLHDQVSSTCSIIVIYSLLYWIMTVLITKEIEALPIAVRLFGDRTVSVFTTIYRALKIM